MGGCGHGMYGGYGSYGMGGGYGGGYAGCAQAGLDLWVFACIASHVSC